MKALTARSFVVALVGGLAVGLGLVLAKDLSDWLRLSQGAA